MGAAGAELDGEDGKGYLDAPCADVNHNGGGGGGGAGEIRIDYSGRLDSQGVISPE